jgi:hypothetical protein
MPRGGRGMPVKGQGNTGPDLGFWPENVCVWGSVLHVDRRPTFCPPRRSLLAGLGSGYNRGIAILSGFTECCHQTTVFPMKINSIPCRFKWLPVLMWALVSGIAHAEDGLRVDFNRDIRPLLSNACFRCHGPDSNKRQAGLRLDQSQSAFAELESGARAIIPGDPVGSELVARISAADPDFRMPPAEHGEPLSAEQVERIRLWIEQGAEYQTHWSFIAPRRTALPFVKETSWPRNAIDFFVLAQLEAKGLPHADDADRQALIRRLAFDITGLPPTLEEVDAFVRDSSPAAYERLVEKYLASPAYGENMARSWLDLARYADTNGYQYDTERTHWVWRDWVIHAYNQNKPFDQFTIEQLAGDLISDATSDQILATGFNRNHGITIEGGVIDEEYRTEYVMDRLITTGTVWLGLTVGCARCHDHKYDPISQQEFYQLYAYFNLVPERGQSGFQPSLQAVSPLAARKIAALATTIEELHNSLAVAKEDDLKLEEWASALANGSFTWRVQTPVTATSSGGTTITPLEDNSLLASGANPQNDIYEIQFTTPESAITAVRIECLTHPSLPGNGPGRYQNSNFVLTGFLLEASSIADPSQKTNVTFREARADYNQKNYEVRLALSSDKNKGWAVDGPTRKKPATAIFVAEKPFGFQAGTTLKVILRHEVSFGQHGIGRPRISISSAAPARLSFQDIDAAIVDAAKLKPGDRTAEQHQVLRTYYLDNHGPAKQIAAEIARLEKQRSASFPATMIMRDQENIRTTHILNRGQYNQPAAQVFAGTPQVLPPMPDDLPKNRLGLAQWLMSPAHPLTARVAINRYWQQFFGNGLVKTSEDFGNQGARASHPGLLDWLAVEFASSQWDVKNMVRLIVTSATYRQTSHAGRENYRKDPENLLLGRGPRMRLAAEQVRDNALAISGLLVNALGGTSVYPYQPKGIWMELNNRPGFSKEYPQGSGKDLYRRSLYTFWKRTVPSPMLKTLDAPEREFCTLKRSQTNTPLQSLLLLNGPQFVEAARHMAVRVLNRYPHDQQKRLAYAFRLATGRHPDATELVILAEAFDEQREEFEQQNGLADSLLAVGDSPPDTIHDKLQLATWTTLCRLLMNLDETITKG